MIRLIRDLGAGLPRAFDVRRPFTESLISAKTAEQIAKDDEVKARIKRIVLEINGEVIQDGSKVKQPTERKDIY